MEAKLNNGQLEYYQDGSTIMIGKNLVTNPTPEQRFSEGYREVINRDGNGGVYVDGDFIIVETPVYIAPVLTPAQQRERAYREDKVIEWQGEMLTCDEARLNRMSAYYYSGQTDKLAQIQQLWLDARESIQLQYTGEVIQDIQSEV